MVLSRSDSRIQSAFQLFHIKNSSLGGNIRTVSLVTESFCPETKTSSIQYNVALVLDMGYNGAVINVMRF